MAITISSIDETPIHNIPVTDNLSQNTAIFTCRSPTTAEKTSYLNEAVVRKGKKVVSQLPEARAKYAQKLIIGIRDGDWEIPVGQHPNAAQLGLEEGAKHAPMSSDPKSPAYVPEWKRIVFRAAPHMFDMVAAILFDAPAEAGDINDEDDAEKN